MLEFLSSVNLYGVEFILVVCLTVLVIIFRLCAKYEEVEVSTGGVKLKDDKKAELFRADELEKQNKNLKLQWVTSKYYSKYRNCYLWEEYAKVASWIFLIYKHVDDKIFQVNLRLWVYVSGWRMVSQRILDNHFSGKLDILRKECSDFAESIVVKIQQDVCASMGIEMGALDIKPLADELVEFILKNRDIKAALAQEMSDELGFEPTVRQITQVIRIIR